MNISAPLIPDPGFKNFLKKNTDTRQPREYQKYEFCKDVCCECHIPENKAQGIKESCVFSWDPDCILTAKEFHTWLKENGFRIVKAQGVV